MVQVYLGAPADKLNKPKEELAAFGKTKSLKPGQTETMYFVLKPRDLASFDTASSSWIAEAGTYVIKIGASSRVIKGSVSFDLEKELIVKQDNKAFSPQKVINMMKKP